MRRVLLATLAFAACTKADVPPLDAGTDGGSPEVTPVPLDAELSLSVDFTVEDCPSFDPQAPACTGKVPLTLLFVPLATTAVTQYIWDFGDTTPFDSETTPSHTYTMPGVYTVKVLAAGAAGGVMTKIHSQFVIAAADGAGDACTSNPQCGGGLYCLCSASAPCATGPALGMCASSCQTSACDSDQVCAGLLTATPPSGEAAPWQTSLCLLGCSVDADCATGLRCRTLPPGPTGSAWVRGCFTDLPGDVGDPCSDASGAHRNDLCASGFCADLGAKGLCSMDCSVASCPPGSDCGVLGDGRKLCLRPCGPFTCSADPLLTCVVPGPGDSRISPGQSREPNRGFQLLRAQALRVQRLLHADRHLRHCIRQRTLRSARQLSALRLCPAHR